MKLALVVFVLSLQGLVFAADVSKSVAACHARCAAESGSQKLICKQMCDAQRK